MDYTILTLILPHSQPTLNLILIPESRSRSRTVRPNKGGGGWERGVEHVGYIVHAQY